MRLPAGAGNDSGGGYGSLSSPAVVVGLVLLIGATIFLWRARYIRRKTAYVWLAVLFAALVAFAVWVYLHPIS